MHDEFLLLYGRRDAFFDTKLADHIVVLIALAHVAGVLRAHTHLHVTFFIGEAFSQHSQTILAVIFLAIRTGHVFIEIEPFAFEALHEEALPCFLKLIDVFVTITRQQSDVASIRVIQNASLAQDRFVIRTVTGGTSVGKERFLFLGQGHDLRVDCLVLLKRSCQVLGMRQLTFLKLGVHDLATFLVVGRGIRFSDRRHDEFYSPRQLATHAMGVGHLSA